MFCMVVAKYSHSYYKHWNIDFKQTITVYNDSIIQLLATADLPLDMLTTCERPCEVMGRPTRCDRPYVLS